MNLNTNKLSNVKKLGKFVPSRVTRLAGEQALTIGKHSPRILFVAGVTGMVGSTVLACRATLKLEEVLDDGKRNMDTSKELFESGHPDYSENDHKKDSTYIYIRTAVRIIKLYAPAILVGSLSVAALTKSHNMLARRNAALAAAYTAVDKAFREYRARVVNEYGAEKDREFRYDGKKVEVLEEGTNGPKKVKKMAAGDGGASMYAKFFDHENKNWNATPEYNIMFLRSIQNYLNDRLTRYGHVMLNEAYDELGLERTSAGQIVGWVRGHGDGFIDFGIFNPENEYQLYDFVTGREGCILLDFNVDGPVYDLIDKI